MNKSINIVLGFFLLFAHAIAQEKVLDRQNSRYIELTIIHSPQRQDKHDLVFRFNIRNPYHINSGSPLIEGLIPTTVTVKKSKNSTLLIPTRIDYPPDEILDIAGFRTTVYFGGPHDLVLNFGNQLSDSETINYDFHYQACKDDECYAPESISGEITLPNLPSGAINSINTINHRRFFSWMSNFMYPEIFLILAFAFLGGLILNFTPCVLPILSLKLLSLSAMKDSKIDKRRHVAFYIGGALTFFLLLAIGVIVLKTGGEEIGWGFQFQSPYYIFFIILTLGVVTLNLFGVYEVPFSYISRIEENSTEKKLLGENLKNFGTGFISVILATPCTVPFLGIAVAYSFSQGALVILFLHLLVALGFISPYALIFVGVDISRIIPRIRPAEKYIKKVFGFILILTIIWLIDIYWTLTGNSIYLLLALWFSALVLWGYGQFQKYYLSSKWQWPFWIVILIVWGVIIAQLPMKASIDLGETLKKTTENSSNVEVNINDRSLIPWKVFSKAALQDYIDAGHIVYVHFTADWCLNCKVNEKLILERDEVIKLFQLYQVVMMKADWTRSNKEIFSEIQSLSRAGIPLDVLYMGNETIVLSTILTVGEFQLALQKLTDD